MFQVLIVISCFLPFFLCPRLIPFQMSSIKSKPIGINTSEKKTDKWFCIFPLQIHSYELIHWVFLQVINSWEIFANITNLRGNILIDQQVTRHFSILLPESDFYCRFVLLHFLQIFLSGYIYFFPVIFRPRIS